VPLDDFGAVDTGPRDHLVAMMHATDQWPAVQAVRAWTLDRAAVGAGSLVVDVGSGPCTCGRLAAARSATIVDLDPSAVMLRAAHRARVDAPVACGSVAALPFRCLSGSRPLVRVERVLQWTLDPYAALRTLWALVPAGGWLAVTDTDWGAFTIEHPDEAVREAVETAARRWMRHPTLAAELPDLVAARDPHETRTRRDTVVIEAWTPDLAGQDAGPPGLPLRSIAPDRGEAVDAIVAEARRGRFRATLDLVTVLARR
jgi:trans-aconitate methyltransferase